MKRRSLRAVYSLVFMVAACGASATSSQPPAEAVGGDPPGMGDAAAGSQSSAGAAAAAAGAPFGGASKEGAAGEAADGASAGGAASGGGEGAPSKGGGAAGAVNTVACSGKTKGAGDSIVELSSGGDTRTSSLHVPAGYDPTRAAMLVLNFHGYPSDADQEIALSKMNAASDTHGFLVAYPEGSEGGWNAGNCCTSADDVQFVRDLLVRLESDYCLDPKQVYSTGMSNGGEMTQRLACEMSDTFAAIAPVAGVFDIPTSQCAPTRAMPVLEFHGTGDPLSDYSDAEKAVSFWRGDDACSATGTTTFAKGDATCETWSGCTGGAVVTFCSIADGGHTWPGGLDVPLLGKTSSDLDATEAMVAFFLAHPLP